MLIYTDVITKEEVLTDAYPLNLIDDIVYEVEGKSIVIKEEDYDIGANPSAEEENENLEKLSETTINVVKANRLQQTVFDKDSYKAYIKTYMKTLLTHLKANNPSRVEKFTKGAQEFVAKKILPNFDEFTFWIGESSHSGEVEGGMIILCFYKETTPYFYYFKDGLLEEKV